nr:phage exclusion protein Lit family protein [Xanthomonas sp.]
MVVDASGPRGPRVVKRDGEPAFIQLHLPHLELLWAFTYGWLVQHEEVQRRMIDKSFDGVLEFNTAFLQRSQHLLNWASSLRGGYTRWPDGLPSPVTSTSDAEKNMCDKVNGIFQYAVAFLMYHEFAHARQGHIGVVAPHDMTAEALATSIEMEREADDFAYRVMVALHEDDSVKRLKGWAVLVPALSSLYLVADPGGLRQMRHPHLHHRISNLLGKLSYKDEESKFYYEYLCTFILGQFLQSFRQGTKRDQQVHETAEELLEAQLDELDEILSQLESR